MTPGDILFLDTNVLLAATVTGRKEHNDSIAILATAIERGIHLATSGQILREYLVVGTRPTDRNGLDLSVGRAVHNVDQFLKVLVLYHETEAVTKNLLSLVTSFDVSGKRIHDANIVALMGAHNIPTLVTLNQSDFVQFDRLTLLSPSQAASELQP